MKTSNEPYKWGETEAVQRGRRGFLTLLAGLAFLGSDFAEAQPREVRLLALGDSLTAGYGLPARAGFPAKLEAALRGQGMAVTVINGGVSGDTSAGGLARLDWMLADKPTHVIVELGANDGLRGLDPKQMEANLDAIIVKLKAAGAKVLLTGMRAPPNFGSAYTQAFNSAFSRLAERHKVAFYPFFLDGVAANPQLNQADGIHPNEAGINTVIERILPAVLSLLAQS
jgi:acyl-CoA thioesterase I